QRLAAKPVAWHIPAAKPVWRVILQRNHPESCNAITRNRLRSGQGAYASRVVLFEIRRKFPRSASVVSAAISEATQESRQHSLQHVVVTNEVVIERRADMGECEDNHEKANPTMDG